MSRTEHIEHLLPEYALELLPADETAQVVEHLAICPACQAELRAYQAAAVELPLALAEAAPPPALKTRLMNEIRQQMKARQPSGFANARQKLGASLQRWSLALSLAGAALILLLGASTVYFWQRYTQLQLRQPALLQIVAMTGTTNAPAATGALIISAQGEYGTLVVDHLASLDAGHQYQLWLVRDGTRANGGVFSVNPEGYASLRVSSPLPLSQYQSFGITIEPFGGSPGPTGAKVLGSSSPR